MLEIVLGIVVVICILAIIIVIISNKYQFAIIKIDKAEEDISLYLEKKRELLDRTKPIIIKELKLDDFMSDLDTNVFEKVNNFEENDTLKRCYNELFKIIDENEKLLKSDSLLSILESLNDNEEDVVGAIKFYNDTVVEFNQLIMSFPSNIIGFFKRYKKKEFYNNEKREIYDILNDDK